MFASLAVCPRGRRASSRVGAGCVVNSVPCGSASRARRVCGVCGAVPWGLLLGRSRGWRCAVGICVSGASRVWRVCRCAMGIAAGEVAWVALCRGDLRLGRVACVACVPLCHGDCCWGGRVGGAVPWGLLLGRSRGCRCAVGICVSGASRVWRGCRCAMGIAAGTGQVVWVPLCCGDLRLGRVACVACVALCHGDCCWAGRVGAAVPWGLLLGGSRGWRCAMGIAAGRVARVALCHGDCCWACRGCGAVPWGLLVGVVWVAPCLRDC